VQAQHVALAQELHVVEELHALPEPHFAQARRAIRLSAQFQPLPLVQSLLQLWEPSLSLPSAQS